jgi:hypothetical protein
MKTNSMETVKVSLEYNGNRGTPKKQTVKVKSNKPFVSMKIIGNDDYIQMQE